MNIKERINILVRLGKYIISDAEEWQAVKLKAFANNNWFTIEFIDLAVENIAAQFLQEEQLNLLFEKYKIPQINDKPRKIGLVLAGNIPLVGFHDVLCSFITGHYAFIKPSSKDDILVAHIIEKMIEWNKDSAANKLQALYRRGGSLQFVHSFVNRCLLRYYSPL